MGTRSKLMPVRVSSGSEGSRTPKTSGTEGRGTEFVWFARESMYWGNVEEVDAQKYMNAHLFWYAAAKFPADARLDAEHDIVELDLAGASGVLGIHLGIGEDLLRVPV